jgi:hypothetical protein
MLTPYSNPSFTRARSVAACHTANGTICWNRPYKLAAIRQAAAAMVRDAQASN